MYPHFTMRPQPARLAGAVSPARGAASAGSPDAERRNLVRAQFYGSPNGRNKVQVATRHTIYGLMLFVTYLVLAAFRDFNTGRTF